jgi:hypothetical protein
VGLSGTLYLPAGYDKVKKEKLPLFYFENIKQNSAGQNDQNPNEFTLLWIIRLLGYYMRC